MGIKDITWERFKMLPASRQRATLDNWCADEDRRRWMYTRRAAAIGIAVGMLLGWLVYA